MTLADVASYPAVFRQEYLDRLAALSARPEVTPDLWTEVHDAVQEQLAHLDTDVRQKVAGIRVHSGRTRGDRFFLFSHITFSVTDSALDPVVVGMTFTPAPQGVIVEADVSGEQTGDWISSAPRTTVANSKVELLAAARKLAQKLCHSAQAIATALKDPSRRVE